MFDQMRAKLKILLHSTVHTSVFDKEIPSLEELKTFLSMCFRELKYTLKDAKSFDDVMDIVIEQKCTIVNVTCLEVIANHYNIEEAKAQIAAYKSEVDSVCKEFKLRICDDYMTGPTSLLKCEIISFNLEWRPDRDALSDIKELLYKAFEDITKRIDIHHGNVMIVVSIAHMQVDNNTACI